MVHVLCWLSVVRNEEGKGREGGRRLLTDWEDKAPPAHVERKATTSPYHYDSDDEPDNGETP